METVAPKLLGWVIKKEESGHTLRARIIEVEAYDQSDAASHSYKGRTQRADVMFGPAGHLYVYFTYGMHYCANVVAGSEGHGAAILIRAVEPLEGAAIMEHSRGGRSGFVMTNGPAKLCQAFGIDLSSNGHDLRKAPLQLERSKAVPSDMIQATTRIGISKAQDKPWRFYVKGNPWVSKS